MTTIKSYSNGQLFLSTYKNTLYKIKWAALMYLIFSFIIYPGMYMSSVKRILIYNENGVLTKDYIENMFCGQGNVYTQPSNILYMLLIIVVAMLLGIIVNNYMHNKKQIDVYHALPVKREIMMSANYAAVATVMIVPVIICYLSVVGINGFSNIYLMKTGCELGISTTGVILLEMVRMIIYILSFLSIIFLSCVCANTTFDAVIFSVSLSEIVPLTIMLSNLILTTFVKGYTLNQNFFGKGVLSSPINMIFVSVVGKSNDYISSDLFKNINIMTYVWAVLAIVFFAAALIIYKKRKSEIAQSSDISGFVYKLVMTVGVFGIASVSAIITSSMSGKQYTSIMTIIFAGIYGFLYYFILQGIFTRSMKLKITNHVVLILCILAAPLFMVLARTGWFGYESYIPNPEKIKSANIDYYGVYRNEGVINSETGVSLNHKPIKYTSENEKEIIITIHKTILENLHVRNDDENSKYLNCTIEYELKNGKTVTRNYFEYIPKDMYKKLMLLNESPELKKQKCNVFIAPVEQIEDVQITTGYGENIELLEKYKTKENYEMLIQAIKNDMLAETLNDLTEHRGAYICHIYLDYEIKDFIYSSPGYIITDKYVNTLAALKEMGIDLSDKKEPPQDCKIDIQAPGYFENRFIQSNIDYYSEGAYNEDNSFCTVTDPELIKEILENAIIADADFNGPLCYITIKKGYGTANYFIYPDNLPKEVKDQLNSHYVG